MQANLKASSNVTSLAKWKQRDTTMILRYLCTRLEVDDLTGLVIQSLGRDGKERVHMTGVYKTDPAKALGASLKLSMMLTSAQGGFEDDD